MKKVTYNKLKNMKKIFVILTLIATIAIISMQYGCEAGKQVASAKTGSQLWAENCGRCHNAPGSSVYSNDQWEVLVMHMKTRAVIPDEDCKKVLAFLQGQ